MASNSLIDTLSTGTAQAMQNIPANPYKEILMDKSINISFESVLFGILGMCILLGIAWICSTNRKGVHWPTIGKGVLMQLIIAGSVLYLPPVQTFFDFFGKCFVAVLNWTKAGSEFLFGNLIDPSQFGFIFAFQILPTIIFFSALTSLFFYLGIIQKVVWLMAWLLTKALKLSGAESLAVAGNIFLGQTEAPLMVKAYVPSMTRSEIMLVMSAGMATMAGGVLAAYIGMLGGGDTVMEMEFAKHLLSASVMAAPGAIVISKILAPQTEDINNKIEITKDKIGKNILDAISNGATEGLKLAGNVAAMLLVFYALIAGCNFIFGKIGEWSQLN
ncbi:MAG: Na+ dependent nucleoside transporter, partial [Prevotellaceae bacterium]|nr:Na+ dependent nucleoside transporter [Prevotellaceae bacterium]